MLLGSSAQLVEKVAVAIDTDRWDSGPSERERVASSTTREIDHRAFLGDGANALELVEKNEEGGEISVTVSMLGHAFGEPDRT